MHKIANHPLLLALMTGATALGVGGVTVLQANYGIPLALALPALVFLYTIGLPAVLGVACVAAVWGRLTGVVEFGLFIGCAGLVALLFQYAACRALQPVWRRRLTGRRNS